MRFEMPSRRDYVRRALQKRRHDRLIHHALISESKGQAAGLDRHHPISGYEATVVRQMPGLCPHRHRSKQ